MSRIVIAGGPRTGKTTLANHLASHMGVPFSSTDTLIGVEWSTASTMVAAWFGGSPAYVIEGVVVPRALRKWLTAHPQINAVPCDVVYWLSTPRTELTKGQETMAKGCETVWRLVEPELLRRGVDVRRVVDVTLAP